MTTIAYTNGVLAGDSLQNLNGTRMGHVVKVVRSLYGRLVAACGPSAYCHAVRTWARDLDDDNCPAIDGGTAVIVEPDGQIINVDIIGKSVVMGDFFAMGTGSDIALGVMAFGGTAEDAVRIAVALDIHSGGDVHSVRLDGKS